MKENILTVKNLKKIYHTKKSETLAIDDVSFSLDEGDFVAIVGPSGCGKSTILNILVNLESISDGEIIFKNNCKLGYMLQQDSLFEWLSVLDNCLLGLKISKTLTNKSKEYVLDLLNTYGLGEFINSYPSVLSGGMRQRVALIRTLAVKPDFLIMDEPFSALDYQTRLHVSDDVYKIIKQEKKSAIIVTHDIAEAISLANKIIVLTNRPCKIKNIYNIEFKETNAPIENRYASEFSEYYNLIWKDIDIHE